MSTFADNGVEDLETILELDEKHLEVMGLPLGHKLKVMKRIKDLRKDKGMSVPESRQGGQRPHINDSQVDNVNKEVRPHKRNDLEALPEPENAPKLAPTSKSGATNTAGNG